MLNWFRGPPKSPVPEADRLWIESRFQWLTQQFGVQRLQSSPLILPTKEYFPDQYYGDEEEINELMGRVARYMGVDPALLRLNFYDETQPGQQGQSREGTIGLYSESDGEFEIGLEISMLDEPLRVIATLAHEIGHVLLLGQRRVSPREKDHELLTDLVTVFMGLGVFTANAVLRESNWTDGPVSGWSVGRQGYMTMDMHGYAFALYALARGEQRPAWASSLRPDVRSAFKKGLRFITQTQECTYIFPDSADE